MRKMCTKISQMNTKLTQGMGFTVGHKLYKRPVKNDRGEFVNSLPKRRLPTLGINHCEITQDLI